MRSVSGLEGRSGHRGRSDLDRLSDVDAATFERERARLTGLAYRLLGSLTDAEDVVQDAWLRWQATDRSAIDRPPAWLTTVVSRLGIDRLRARRREQERYIGPWLPEPLVGPLAGPPGGWPGGSPSGWPGGWLGAGDEATGRPAPEQPDPDRSSDPAEVAALSDSLTTAFLLMLEELTPTERLTVLLADVFDEPFSSVAQILDKSESAVRQQAVRARRKLRAAAPAARPAADADQIRTAEAFLAATALGDLDTVMSLLAPDVVLLSDGGPHHRAARRPVVGPHRVARLALNLAGRIPPDATITLESINGSPGAVVRVGGEVNFVVAVDVVDGLVHTITSVINPDKLAAIDQPHVIT
jgi:RNA polymerase sigma-70 factor (ECF subfamily)